MITYYQLLAKMREIAEKELGHAVDDEYVKAFASAAVQVFGFNVSNNGEIVDPRPTPPSPSYPQQRGPSYSKYDRGRRRR